MLHNRIGRTIYITYCSGQFYNSDNELIPFELKFRGNYDVKRCTSKAMERLGTNRLIVDPESIVVTKKWYSMPIDLFIEYADVYDSADQEQESQNA